MAQGMADVWLRIPCDTFYLGLVRKVIVDLASKMGFKREEMDKIEIAVDEACTIVIKQARKDERVLKQQDRERKIDLNVEMGQDCIMIRIVGLGSSLDIDTTQASVPEQLLEGMKMSELGKYIIKNFMDTVEYRTTARGENELMLTKQLKK